MKRIINCFVSIALILIICLSFGSKSIFADVNCELEEEGFLPWTSGDSLPAKSGKYYLTQDINLNEVQYISGDNDVSICLNGFNIKQNAGHSEVVILDMNATLSVYDCTEKGQAHENYVAGKISGGSNSCIRLLDNVITEEADKGATFNLYGGIICDNNSIEYGGALCIEGHGTFNMYGGLFTNNTAYKCGGAVYAAESSDVRLLGGAFTNNNTNQDGGAVYLYTGTTGFVDGTTFINNSSIYDGGAIYGEAVDTFIQIDSGTFKQNRAKSGGGAVAIFTQGTLVINDAEIFENEATYGGGIWVRKAYATINDVHVFNNKATESGGGLQAQGIDMPFQKTCLTLKNAHIENNEAPLGGGIFIGGTGKIYIEGGLVENNVADNGGGLYVGTLGYGIISKIEIKNNEARNAGGGVYCQRGSKSFLNDFNITNNSALTAGGLYVDDDFVMSNMNISNNSASDGVGGVLIAPADYDGESYYSSIIKMDGNLYIYDNEGKYPNMYIFKGSIVNGTDDGLSEDAKIGLSIEEKDLTSVLVGKYDYRKANGEYLITKGDSYPVKNTNVILIIIIVIAVLVIASLLFVFRKKIFKKAGQEA